MKKQVLEVKEQLLEVEEQLSQLLKVEDGAREVFKVQEQLVEARRCLPAVPDALAARRMRTQAAAPGEQRPPLLEASAEVRKTPGLRPRSLSRASREVTRAASMSS